MNSRKLVLLNPYQLPTQSQLTLADEDMACWLNGYSALWHPAALWHAFGPPKIEPAYDHDQPKPDHIYAWPESPPMYLPDDWEQRVREAGSIVIRATPDREKTLANLREALLASGISSQDAETAAVFYREELTPEHVAPFFGLGMGYVVSSALCDAMEHQNLLDANRIWQDIQQALACLTGSPGVSDEPDPSESPTPASEGCSRHLQAAAGRLLAAREVLYPVTIYLLDFCLLEEIPKDGPLPASFNADMPLNLIASSSHLEELQHEQPELIERLRQKISSEQAEVCGGCYAEREDALLPLESQLWNLLKGQEVARAVLGTEVQVFARRRFCAHAQLPLLLTNAGLSRGLLITFDDSVLPAYQAVVVSWPSPDGKQVDCFVRRPLPADSADTFFNLAHSLFKTIREDHYATLALFHRAGAAAPWYRDWLELSRLAPVLGQWHTCTQFFNQTQPGEYVSTLSADDFHFDYLSERVPANHRGAVESEPEPSPRSSTEASSKTPVSGFARHARLRRRLDTCWTLAALQRGLVGRHDPLQVAEELRDLEDQYEKHAPDPSELPNLGSRFTEIEQRIAVKLAERLLARATGDQPGYLLLNPCSFTRRAALELDGVTSPLLILDPVKACQLDGDHLSVVVEVPALGFAWIPRSGPKGALSPALRMRLADEHGVRNEFFEAELDPSTGGLRGIRDHRSGVNRLAQRLVFNPGSTMRASEVKVTSVGPALGEIVTEGALLGERDQLLAKFRQRFRAWLGRPVLELRIELFPEIPPAGNPWHAYFGSRFAWREERGVLLRGMNGSSHLTTHQRPQTPDFLELRLARQSTVILPGGLPFHQRQEGRMVDVILAPAGETAQVFELGLALDREHPMQTALGMITPVPLVPTEKGPPHIGANGWLFHLDAPNLLLTSMRPGGVALPVGDGEAPRDGVDAITVRLVESAAYHSHAELRCVRDPRRATLLDARGNLVMEAHTNGDAAILDISSGDLVQLQVEFS